MSINNGLKAYVRYDGTGRIVPGGPIFSHTKPKNGDWVEVDSLDCCITTSTTSTSTTTSTTTAIPYYTFRLAYQSVLEGACLLTPNQDFYSNSSYLFVGTTPPAYLGSILYTDTALTIPAPNGFYHTTSNTGIGAPSVVFDISDIAGNPGEVTSGYTCNLLIKFSDITAVDTIVGDSSNVADWNSYFDLPTYGTPFLSVVVFGNDVYLEGTTNTIIIKESLFDQADELGSYLLEFNDVAGFITEVRYNAFGYDTHQGCFNMTYINLPKVTTAGDYAFYYAGDSAASFVVNLPSLVTAGDNCFDSCGITTISLPALTTAGVYCFGYCQLTSVNLPLLNTAGNYCFSSPVITTISLPSLTITGDGLLTNCYSLTTISLPSCTNLGTSVANNFVFNSIAGNTITLTIPTALMTCNAGSPDGDIQYLQANNTVTIVTV